MDFFEVCHNRFTYRGTFKKDTISDLEIEKILTAALSAPKAYNVQTTSYVVVNNAELIEKLGNVTENKSVKSAPLIIVVLTQDRSKELNIQNFELENVSCAVSTAALAISALGYTSGWLDHIMTIEKNQIEIKKLLNIPEEKIIYCLLPIGKPADNYETRVKESIENTVVFNGF